MDLKYLGNVYSQADEDLKKQPEFLKRLKSIDEMIDLSYNSKSYFAPSFSATPYEKVSIDLSYTLASGGNLSEESNNRVVSTYQLHLDQNNHLVCEESRGMFTRKKNPYASEGQKQTYDNQVDGSYEFTSETIANDTVIERQVINSPLNGGESLNINLVFDNSPLAYEYKDKELKTQVFYRKPLIVNGNITLDSIKNSKYSAYSAVRNPEDMNKVAIKEFIQLDGKKGAVVTKDYLDVEAINMGNEKAMRIDAPYGVTTYTEEQIEAIYKMRLEEPNNEKFLNAVLDMNMNNGNNLSK